MVLSTFKMLNGWFVVTTSFKMLKLADLILSNLFFIHGQGEENTFSALPAPNRVFSFKWISHWPEPDKYIERNRHSCAVAGRAVTRFVTVRQRDWAHAEGWAAHPTSSTTSLVSGSYCPAMYQYLIFTGKIWGRVAMTADNEKAFSSHYGARRLQDKGHFIKEKIESGGRKQCKFDLEAVQLWRLKYLF